MKLTGTYADKDVTLEYVCRVILYRGQYRDGLGAPVEVKHGDALLMLGDGSWLALYRPNGKTTERDVLVTSKD